MSASNRANREGESIVSSITRDHRLFQAVLDQMGSGVVVAEAPSGRILFHNQAATRLLGHPVEPSADYTEYGSFRAVHKDGTPYRPEEYPGARALAGNVVQEEMRYRRGDGTAAVMDVNAAPVRDDDGRVIATVTAFHDITKLKRTEAELRESENRFRLMADNLPLIVWIHDVDGNQEFVNETFAEYFGVSREEMRAGRWRILMHPDDAAEYTSAFLEACRNRTPFNREVRVKRGDGEWRWIRSWARPRFDAEGYYLGHIGTSADITDQRAAEETLRQSREMLESMVAERTDALHRQTRRLRAVAWQASTAEQRERKRLAAMLHDELQQYLVAAKLKMYRSRRRLGPGETGDTLDEAIRMIDQALDSSRDLTHELRPPVLYEAGLVPALQWLASEMWRRHQLRAEVIAPEENVHLGQEGRAFLYSAVQELLFNVVKHAQGEFATVTVRTENGMLTIAVIDDGVGLEVDTLEESGDGMGLFSVGERLAAFGGSINIESRPGEGTTVVLLVPLGEALLREPAAAQEEPAAREETAVPAEESVTSARASEQWRRGGRKREIPRVLLVDDHVIVRMGIATLLREDGSVAIHGEATTAREAIRRIEVDPPDVVLMDINLPGEINGFEATRVIRRRFPEVAVIGLSVQDDESSVRSLLDAGAAAFVSKSEDAVKIREAIFSVFPRR